jgi:cysteinyl-tRNA synthetase
MPSRTPIRPERVDLRTRKLKTYFMIPGSKLVGKPIFLTNTKSHQKETFRPMVPGVVKMYSCGPTVWSDIHVGNLRAGLTADLFYRFFKRFGYQVDYVRNYTDVDDKIINRANQEKTSTEAITEKYTKLVEQDYALAGMEEPTHKTKVTEHMPEIIAMIQKILENGKAYVAKDGEVLFAIDQFKSYGELSGKTVDDLQARTRVEVNPNKKNPMDFTLWKPAKPNEPSWDSPWGKGRPGWHIECSAMACKWLGPQMDLHHGGEDLIFPHHENEIAQSESANGIAPYVKYWVHNAHLNLSGEKMSKSLGNVVNAREFLAKYGAEVTRMIFLGVHYRAAFDLTQDSIDNAIASLERIYEAKKVAEEIRAKHIRHPDMRAEQGWGSFLIDCDRTRDAILENFANDLNTAGALAQLFTLVREWNRSVAAPNAANTPAAILAANEFIKIIEEEIGAVIGVGRMSADTMLAKIAELKIDRQKSEGKTVLEDAEIDQLLQERKDVRIAKDFKRSDEIRIYLLDNGVEIKDSPAGTTWTRK